MGNVAAGSGATCGDWCCVAGGTVGDCAPDRGCYSAGAVDIGMAGSGRTGTGVAGVDRMLGYSRWVTVNYINIVVRMISSRNSC